MQWLPCLFQSRNMNNVQVLKKYFDIKNCRYFSLYFNNKQQPHKQSNTGYIPIYKFPYIHQLSLINRLKFYQTIVTTTSIPCAFMLNYFGYMDFNNFATVTYTGATLCLAFYTLGLLANRFIGIIYYNKNSDLVKISCIDFWGQRKDIEMPAQDVIPQSEIVANVNDKIYLNFRRYSTKDSFRFSVRYGIILEKELMKQLL